MREIIADKAGEKRTRILAAARELVLRNGLRGTTMEAIAREAQIAKPTLYAHFPDKDAIYAAIVDGLTDDLLAAFEAGMKAPGALADRAGLALAGQFTVLARALDGSPHASELMSEHKRAGVKFREKDEQAFNALSTSLDEAGFTDAGELTRLIMSAAYGIALKTSDEAAMVAGIKLLCRRMIPADPG